MLPRPCSSAPANGCCRGSARAPWSAPPKEALGGAALVPADWWLHTQDGQDYTFADALKSVVLSAGMGAAAHGGLGLLGDIGARARGRPLPGSIEDLRVRALAGDTHAADIVEQLGGAGVHLPEGAFEPAGVDTDEMPGITAPEDNAPVPVSEARHPAEVLADLPPSARENVLQATIADITAGRPARAAEMLTEAAKEDPRIAESIEAWHGSPHDFERFDSGKIGVGEGAQVYGHGLYFAENERVGSSYRTAGTDLSDAEQVAMHALQVADGDKDRALQYLADAPETLAEQYDIGTLEGAQKLLKTGWDGNRGNLYKVQVRANKDHFLDYEKPLAEQSEHVRSAVEKLQAEHRARDENSSFGTAEPVETGATLYERLASELEPPRPLDPSKWHAEQTGRGPGQFANTWRVTDPDGAVHSVAGVRTEAEAIRQAYELAPGWGRTKRDGPAASRLLAERGIPGIKYLDQGSRRLLNGPAETAKTFAERIKSIEDGTYDPAINGPLGDKAERIAGLRADIERLTNETAEQERHETRNYVVFDDKLIRITHKNGKEVGLDEMKAAQTGAPGLPTIDNSHDVVSGANSAKNPNGPVYVDRRIPEFSPTLKDRDGNPANLHKYLAIHERTEADAEARGLSYDKAHTDVATPAERAAVEADGVSWKGYTDEIDGYLSKIEHEKAANPPTEPLHVDPEAAIGHHRASNKNAPAEAEPKSILRKTGGRGPRARDPQTWSLLEFLAHKGGIDPGDANIGDVHALTGGKRKFIPGFGDLVRKGGMKLDRAREAAVEAGYLHDSGVASGGESKSTVNDLLDAMDGELRGKRVYRYDRVPEHAQRAEAERTLEINRAHAETELDATLKEIGEDPAKMPDARRERVLEIMTREGESDPLIALEREALEAYHAEAETGQHEPLPGQIPGWNDDAVGGRASDTGGAGAGRDLAAQGADRAGARGGGAADRSPQSLAQRADWLKLRDVKPSEDDNDLAAASRAADKAPEVASTEPAKAVSAAQAAAGEADKLLADLLPKLTEAERKTFEETLSQLSDDQKAREQIVRDGAACLAEAAA